MSFLTAAALLVGLLVAAPVAAHLLRRRQAEERPFPLARFVRPTPPTARRRSLLEDRALFAIRALSVLALAVLGATPFVRCSRLALARRAGASVAVAIVVDDSLSMRAPLDGGVARKGATTRFERALAGARELVQGLGAGDAVAVVLAGAPARVALAATTNMVAVTGALEGLEPSDRATDLDGALRLSRELLKGLVHVDKRIVVLSDLADGKPGAAPIAGDGGPTIWAPLPELEARGSDCAITRADRAGTKVRARVVCSPPSPSTAAASASGAPSAQAPAASSGPGDRKLELCVGANVVGTASLDPGSHAQGVAVEVPREVPTGAALRVRLTGADAIAEDDEAPVVAAGGALPIAVVVDTAASHVATGGPPPVEQAFAALELDAQVRPLPAVPEHPDELAAFAGVLVDDAPGFTPELRRALAAWVQRGGVAMLTLGPRAAAAPLGAGFDPLVPGIVRWKPSPSPGIDPASAPLLGPSVGGLTKLDPRGRAVLDAAALDGADVLGRWADGAPFLVRRSLGRGAVFVLGLPLSTEESDLALRPAFLALLERFVDAARARGGTRRIDVGEAWTFDGVRDASVQRAADGKSPPRAVPVVITDGRPHADPPLAGLYELVLDGERTTRVASVAEREIDLRPRAIEAPARSGELGGVASTVDASPYLALALLGLLAAELFVRTAGQRVEASGARSP
jgi:hypothetical protein